MNAFNYLKVTIYIYILSLGKIRCSIFFLPDEQFLYKGPNQITFLIVSGLTTLKSTKLASCIGKWFRNSLKCTISKCSVYIHPIVDTFLWNTANLSHLKPGIMSGWLLRESFRSLSVVQNSTLGVFWFSETNLVKWAYQLDLIALLKIDRCCLNVSKLTCSFIFLYLYAALQQFLLKLIF